MSEEKIANVKKAMETPDNFTILGTKGKSMVKPKSAKPKQKTAALKLELAKAKRRNDIDARLARIRDEKLRRDW